MLPSLSLPPLEFCFGTSPIQAEKSRPDRNALGSPMLATSAVASAGPTPGMASSRLLVSFDRCHAMMRARFSINIARSLPPKSFFNNIGHKVTHAVNQKALKSTWRDHDQEEVPQVD